MRTKNFSLRERQGVWCPQGEFQVEDTVGAVAE